MFLLLTFDFELYRCFTTFSDVAIVSYKQLNVCWAVLEEITCTVLCLLDEAFTLAITLFVVNIDFIQVFSICPYLSLSKDGIIKNMNISHCRIILLNALIKIFIQLIVYIRGLEFSSYEIELRKMTSKFELQTRKFL